MPEPFRKVSAPEIPAATLAYFTPVGEFIHSADAKAGTILAVLGIMFTLLARFGGWLDAAIRGGGLITTRARRDLAASITGGGAIRYSGDPEVSTAVRGGGTVTRAGN